MTHTKKGDNKRAFCANANTQQQRCCAFVVGLCSFSFPRCCCARIFLCVYVFEKNTILCVCVCFVKNIKKQKCFLFLALRDEEKL